MTKSFLGWAVFCALVLPPPSAACTCMWAGPFLQVGPGAELIVRVRVVRHFDRSRGVDRAMEVEVIEVLKGSSRTRRLKIWGDDGGQCRPYVSGFLVGSEWIFAVSRSRGEKGREQDYAISVCGEYWAKVEGDAVSGRLTTPLPPSGQDRPEKMSLREVREKLRAARR